MAVNARPDPSDPPVRKSALPGGGVAANEPTGMPAREVDPGPAPEAVDAQAATPGNLISRTVEEICTLTSAINDVREDLRARGVDHQQTKLMVERGLKDPPEDRRKLVLESVEQARSVLGSDAIGVEALEEKLDRLVALEKDNRHVRILALQQGVQMQPLNYLTQLIGLNTGDGGVQAVNLFIAYADAAGIPFDRVGTLRAQFDDEPRSVLPDIPRDVRPTRAESARALAADVVVGVVLTVVIMSLVL